jgi:tetratricopeptide (TPR) repeat protein
MSASFNQHFERGDKALSKFENDAAFAAFEAALAVADAPDERALALSGMATICFRHDEDERALDLLDRAIAACQPDGQAPSAGRLARVLAQVWYDKGTFLAALNRNEDALDVFEESIRRFLDGATSMAAPDDDARRLRRLIASTLLMKGSALHALERPREAAACYDDLIRRFQTVDDGRVQMSVARAMRRRAWLFGELGRQDKEIAGYDELFARFGASTDPDITETVLDGLESKMQIYRGQEDLETMIEICDQIIGRYGADPSWRTADTVARAMIRQAVALGRRGARNKELAAYDTVVRLYGDSPEPMLRTHGAKALMFKAVTLSDADETSAEMECYEEVLQRYAADADEGVRAVAADALIHKGLSLGAIAEDAAEDTGERETDAEIACYDEVVSRYGEEEAIGLKRAVAEALLHKAETLMEAGRAGEASLCLESVIAGYASVDDADLQEIVKDARGLQAKI